MKDKTEIRYWLREPGEEGVETHIMRTMTYKVPEVGEVIHFDTVADKGWLERSFNHLPDYQKVAFFPKQEIQIEGDFVVVSVKRYLKEKYSSAEFHSVFQSELTGRHKGPEIPTGNVIEEFEVFIQPFQHSELTETPIAKVRNLLSPILGSFKIIELIKQNPGREKEIIELLVGGLDVANESIEKLLKIVRDDKNWK